MRGDVARRGDEAGGIADIGEGGGAFSQPVSCMSASLVSQSWLTRSSDWSGGLLQHRLQVGVGGRVVEELRVRRRIEGEVFLQAGVHLQQVADA